ncbi:MAG: hypothetical protein ACR2FV_04520 [Ornithinimicrobium sp.]|uniref:hypothetical protein n=1 Tax=Ornithinimicrobium sp. TaxID=1977084 RepID=UPI003D9BFB2A
MAELDYLVATSHGVDAELAVLDELTGGAWELADFGVADVRQARAIIARYHDQEIGAADASNVVFAQRDRTRTSSPWIGGTSTCSDRPRESRSWCCRRSSRALDEWSRTAPTRGTAIR